MFTSFVSSIRFWKLIEKFRKNNANNKNAITTYFPKCENCAFYDKGKCIKFSIHTLNDNNTNVTYFDANFHRQFNGLCGPYGIYFQFSDFFDKPNI